MSAGWRIRQAGERWSCRTGQQRRWLLWGQDCHRQSTIRHRVSCLYANQSTSMYNSSSVSVWCSFMFQIQREDWEVCRDISPRLLPPFGEGSWTCGTCSQGLHAYFARNGELMRSSYPISFSDQRCKLHEIRRRSRWPLPRLHFGPSCYCYPTNYHCVNLQVDFHHK